MHKGESVQRKHTEEAIQYADCRARHRALVKAVQ